MSNDRPIFFSLITLIGSTNAKLPNVSAVKALDVYFGICFVYVFGGLLEFATVIYLETKEKKQTAARKAKVFHHSIFPPISSQATSNFDISFTINQLQKLQNNESRLGFLKLIKEKMLQEKQIS